MPPLARAVLWIGLTAIAYDPLLRLFVIPAGFRHTLFTVGLLAFLLFLAAGYVAAPDRKLRRGALAGALVATIDVTVGAALVRAIAPDDTPSEPLGLSLVVFNTLFGAGVGALAGLLGAMLRRRKAALPAA